MRRGGAAMSRGMPCAGRSRSRRRRDVSRREGWTRTFPETELEDVTARAIGEYRGWRVEMLREGKRDGWRSRLVSPTAPQGSPAISISGDVGWFESSAAAYQDAVRRINLLGD